MLSPGVVVAELGSGGVLLDTRRPTAAYLSPTALGWLHGRPPAAEHHDQHTRCLTQWRSAGLITAGEASGTPGQGNSLELQAAECAALVAHPVLLVAMAASCAFCTQLSSDLAGNADGLTGLDASVLLVDAEGTRRLGRPLTASAREPLTRLGRQAAHQGTPTAVLLAPDRPARVLTGFIEVSNALVTLSGADPRATIVEAPTSCSVNVAAEPIDAVLTTRVNGARLGIAVRGDEPRRIIEAGTGGVRDHGYSPVTLTVERPGTFYLLFRGGELLTRAHTPAALRQTLDAVLAGYASYLSPERDGIPLLCGVAVRDGEHAVLFPRSWMSDFVKRTRQLAKAGWRVVPEPYTMVRITSARHGPRLLDPAGSGQDGPAVTAVLTEARRSGGPPTRAQLLASIVNWIARPATTDAIHTLVGSLRSLPVHTGTWQDALAFLTPAT